MKYYYLNLPLSSPPTYKSTQSNPTHMIEKKETHWLRKKNVLFLIILLLQTSSYGQSYQNTIDSLIIVLQTTQTPSQKVDLLNEISYAYRRTSPKKVNEYAQKAEQLSTQIQYKKGEAIANKNIGIALYKMGAQRDSIVRHFQKAIDIAEKIDDYYTQAACNNNIALVYTTKTDYHTAIQYLLKGIKIFDEHFDKELRLKGLMLGNVGFTYLKLKDYEKAVHYLSRTIEMADRNNLESILSIYLDDFGKAYAEVNAFDKAEIQFKRAIKIHKKLGDFQSSIQNLHHTIEMNLKRNRLENIESMGLEAKNMAKQHQFPLLYARSLNYLSNIYLKKGQIALSIDYGQHALDAAKKIKNKMFEKDALDNLTQAYVLQNNFKEAYFSNQKSTAISDSMINEEKTKLTAVLEANYQTREKEQQIQFLNNEKSIQKNQIKVLGILIFIGFLLILCILFLWYKKRNQAIIIHKKNAKLEEYIAYNLQLENFAYIASHDLKTPLRTIISFTQLLKRKLRNKLDESEQEYLNFIIGGTKEMSFLIEDLLNYSRIQKQELNLEKFEIQPFVEKLLSRVDSFIQEKQARVELHITPKFIDADALKIHQLLQNLILNAIKFHRPNVQPIVKVICTDNGADWSFEIRDNGIGIKAEYFDKIFLIFKRLNNKTDYEGSGIGLAICKKIVEQHGGKIHIESIVGEGSSFFFTIPKPSQPKTVTTSEMLVASN